MEVRDEKKIICMLMTGMMILGLTSCGDNTVLPEEEMRQNRQEEAAEEKKLKVSMGGHSEILLLRFCFKAHHD